MFVGWNFPFNDISSALGLVGDPAGDTVGMLSTKADWLPFPYNQALCLIAAPGAPLRAAHSAGV